MPSGIYQRSEAQKEFCRKLGLKGGRKRILKDKTCPVCGKNYRPRGTIVKNCSQECGLKNRPKKGVNRACKVCGKIYYVMQSVSAISKYCSYGCAGIGKIKDGCKIDRICKCCGKIYALYRKYFNMRGSSFCSKDCMKKYRKTKYFKNKKGKNTSTAMLKKLLWITFSKFIRQRDNGICISCGKKDDWRNMDAGHYIPKTAGLSLYFDEKNVNCQCTYCNRWMHGNLSKYAIALRIKYGENILEELDEKRRQEKKISSIEYQRLIGEYKIKLQAIIDKYS